MIDARKSLPPFGEMQNIRLSRTTNPDSRGFQYIRLINVQNDGLSRHACVDDTCGTFAQADYLVTTLSSTNIEQSLYFN